MQVAKRFLRLSTDDIPREWWFDPNSIDYLYGWGQTDQRVKEVTRTIIEFYGLTEGLEEVKVLYAGSVFLVVLAGAFTPLPYKVFTLSAGFLGAPFLTFLLASIIGRALQFYAVAYIVNVFGENITRIVFKNFTIITFAIVALALLVLLI